MAQRHLPNPVHVSVGSQSRYYIKFSDGQTQWVGPEDLHTELKDTKRSVQSVAFGEDWSTFFVVYKDGYWKWGGDIPSGLRKKLTDRDRKSDLKHVSLGPCGQYYISVANGRAWWGGIGDGASESIRPYKDRITFMDFGDHENTCFVRYE